MEQNKSKSSACRLLGPLATNTSMDFGVLLLRLLRGRRRADSARQR